jgi:hypothetical protein
MKREMVFVIVLLILILVSCIQLYELAVIDKKLDSGSAQLCPAVPGKQLPAAPTALSPDAGAAGNG